MVHKWEFSDGTTVRWTSNGSLLVDGDSKLAYWIRMDLARLAQGYSIHVMIIPDHSAHVALDLTCVWLVSHHLRDQADTLGVKTVSATYTHTEENAPPNVVARWDAARSAGMKPMSLAELEQCREELRAEGVLPEQLVELDQFIEKQRLALLSG